LRLELCVNGVSPEPGTDPNLVEFADIVEPLAQKALEQLIQVLEPKDLSLIAPRALADLRNALTQDLSVIARQVLLQEFQLFRINRENAMRAVVAKITSAPDRQLYETFSEEIKNDGGEGLYLRYPVLTRLFSLRISQWLENTKTFISAYRVDRTQVGLALGLGRLGIIERITAGLSDPHNGGKGVLVVVTDNRKKLVFKPRSINLDIGFMRILAYLNSRVPESLFREIRMLGRKKYGWCEYIQHTTTEDLAKVSDFYFRTGALLAVLHVFRATDCHSENLIASENYPVMIDLETLFHCDYDIHRRHGTDRGDDLGIGASVSRIGLLPTTKDSLEELDLSPLGIRLRPQVVAKSEFKNLGNSLMGLSESRCSIDWALSQPSKAQIDSSAIITQVKNGFQHAYGLIQRHAAEVATEPSLLPSLRTASCRFVARPTAAYYWLRQRGLNPDSLRHGIDRSLSFLAVFRSWAQTDYDPAWFAIAEQEFASLENHDIPYFTVRLSGRTLYCNDSPIARSVFRHSPWALVKRRLLSLSDEDCHKQLQIIDFSFAQQGIVRVESVGRRREIHQKINPLNAVYDLATSIHAASLGARNPANNWLGLMPTKAEGFFRMGLVGSGLYKGAAGIGIFYAAAYAVDGGEEFKLLASNILHTLGARTQGAGLSVLADMGDGGAGIAYALMRGGILLKDPELCAHASRIAHSISDDAILTVECLDLLGGTAGIILSLDVINRVMPSPDLTRKMTLASERLLRDSQVMPSGCLAWRTLDQRYLPGFAHGSAGISYALARAGRALKDSRFLEAARLGRENQARFYDDARCGWKDPRSSDGQQLLTASWCHGTVGIALSHLNKEGDLNTSSGLKPVQRSIELMMETENATHNICCGLAAGLEVSLRTLKDESMAALHERILDRLIDSATLRFKPLHSNTPFISGLFDGAAGIGYQLLRAIAPQRVPSILTFE
jgi:type 2 lantibiotic biosynthesis protein LanM